ncbi:hypothetical protein N1F33_23120 [Pseudomonas aeruginosa]|nr:hypothetical protein [Pseudomonas aeruginosa]MCS8109586.1 hypothetical protein [Pseudomonas aeruginosa]MCS8763278.1 hypothetical protein [Pseudomonas aeruginosa]MCS8929551.1 hypothetical protein [Pseudomonas aeruginosa]
MLDSAIDIEVVFDHLKELPISMLEFPKDRECNQVCELDQARGFRIQKYGDFSIILSLALAMPGMLEFARERLDSALSAALIEKHNSALWVAMLGIEPAKEKIEPH